MFWYHVRLTYYPIWISDLNFLASVSQTMPCADKEGGGEDVDATPPLFPDYSVVCIYFSTKKSTYCSVVLSSDNNASRVTIRIVQDWIVSYDTITENTTCF